ncbi:MAG TPA: hypothetical protein VLJ68_08370, partial [Chitinophagaceae bacterium]|nr:hypothetical protein [Chitinophagaceae bacterium]
FKIELRRICIIAVLTCFFVFIEHKKAQAQDIPPATEQQLENQTDADQGETDDDSYLLELEQFKKDPIRINLAEAEELKLLRVLTDLQIANFISYRKLFGALISIYELQSIPGWDILTIRKILPYVTIAVPVSIGQEAGRRFKDGDHSLLIRVSQVLEKSDGFDHSTPGTKYLGSPQRILLRYRYTYKNLLQYGLVGDKDAGEQFFKGAQSKGFDFYSFHLFARKIGVIQALALGDFTVNMGQGLIQWQSLAFKKSVDVLGIKRQSAVLRPYNSAGEFYFHRGAGITIRKGRIESTAFISFRKIGGNFVTDPGNNEDFISSFLTSGYHRTTSENDDRNNVNQTAVGGNIIYRGNSWQVGVNGVYYKFSLPVQKQDEPYNLYAISGNNWYNLSVDYSYTRRNLHWFGEAAVDRHFNKAFINGLLLSVDPRVDLSFVQRTIGKAYQAINGNAYTENTYPTNETGFFAGITVRPRAGWRFDAYGDIYKFPWLKSQVDAPSRGTDYLVQLTYTPSKQVEVYTRFRNESKQGNQPDNTSTTNYLVFLPKQSWRLQVSYKLNPGLTLRNRVELVWYDHNGVNKETGFLGFFDVLYKPMMAPASAVLRLQYFETGGYNSRIYAYESDVLFSYSIPAFYDKGFRYYLVLNYDISKKLSVWARVAQTIYQDKNIVGSGLDEIQGNKKTELKLQARWIF